MGIAIGIDLGTTNSCVAVVQAGRARVVEDRIGRRVHPSVVSFTDDGGSIAGHAAKDRQLLAPAETVYCAKRLIGRDLESEEMRLFIQELPYEVANGPGDIPVVKIRKREISLPEITALMLRHLRQMVKEMVGMDISEAVITVPANFNDVQRSMTKVAGRIGGFNVLRILNEPTAAALAYGFGGKRAEKIAVYDFGGGTFDITIVELADDIYEVLSTAGDTYLGGEDFDKAVIGEMLKTFKKQHKVDLLSNSNAIQRIRSVAEKVKCQLSTIDDVQATLQGIAEDKRGNPLDFHFRLARKRLEELVAPLVEKSLKVCDEALKLAGLDRSSLDNLVLVGGTTRIPLVRKRVAEHFGIVPRTEINPDEVVAIGAAIQAFSLTGEQLPKDLPKPAPAPITQKRKDPKVAAASAPRGAGAGQKESAKVIKKTIHMVGKPKLTSEPRPPSPFKAESLDLDIKKTSARDSKEMGLAVKPEPRRRQDDTDALFQKAKKKRVGDSDMGLAVKPEPRLRAAESEMELAPKQEPRPKADNEELQLKPKPPLEDRELGLDVKRSLDDLGLDVKRAPDDLNLDVKRHPSDLQLDVKRSADFAESWSVSSMGIEPEPMGPDDSGFGVLNLGIEESQKAVDEDAIELEEVKEGEGENVAAVSDEISDSLPAVLAGSFEDVKGLNELGEPAAEVEELEELEEGEDFEEVEYTEEFEEIGDDLLDRVSNAPVATEEWPEVMIDEVDGDAAVPVETAPLTEDFGDIAVEIPDGVRPGPELGEAAEDFGDISLHVDEEATAENGFEEFPIQDEVMPAPGAVATPEDLARIEEHTEVSVEVPDNAESRSALLLDVTPRALGVAVAGGFCDIIIERNASIPVEQSRLFVTSHDNQTQVAVDIYQGEGRRIEDNTQLGQVLLTDVRPAPRGQIKIRVTFEIDTDGILGVSARNEETDEAQSMKIVLSGGMDDEKVEALVQKYAEQ